MKYEVELEMPRMPNYLTVKRPPGERSEGFKEGPKVDVAELDPEQRAEFIANWIDAFNAHCDKRQGGAA